MPKQHQNRDVQSSLEQALSHHQAGNLAQAEKLYRSVLDVDDKNPHALHYLGVLAHQSNNDGAAIELISKATRIQPNNVEALTNLGFILGRNGKYGRALECLQQAISTNPGYIEAYTHQGNLLVEMGRAEDALVNFNKVISGSPNSPQALSNLANAFHALGRYEEAVEVYTKAISIDQNLAFIHTNLGNSLVELGKFEEASDSFRHSIKINPQDDTLWSNWAVCLRKSPAAFGGSEIVEDLHKLLEHRSTNPLHVMEFILKLSHTDSQFKQLLEHSNSNSEPEPLDFFEASEILSSQSLFLRIMELSVINDAKIERLLAVLRRGMLKAAAQGADDNFQNRFPVSLALHCFVNEYIFFESQEDKEILETLEINISESLENGNYVSSSLVIALSAYRPLFQYSWAARLLNLEWEIDIKELLERQIAESLIEDGLRDSIRTVTQVDDSVSLNVRSQYEQNPYPRWIKFGMPPEARTLEHILRGDPLRIELENYQDPECPKIFVVGCGTGQHALETATTISNSHVLAVDLSLSSLAYAQRKTNELNIGNIEYGHGDLLELATRESKYDLVECVGTLHHLRNPIAGWKVLTDLVKPNGFMKIGLYSEIAREIVNNARSIASSKGLTPSPDNIRSLWLEILEAGDDSDLSELVQFFDFFSLSGCRDLIFHAEEHQFTLLQIDDALKKLQLKFLAFELPNQEIMHRFKDKFPEDEAQNSLPLWHQFELDYPRTFRGMYQFWVQKT